MRFFFFLVLCISSVGAEAFNPGIDIDLDYSNGFDSDFGIQARSDRSKGLEEFTPISNTIRAGDVQQYSFGVNTTAGLGRYYELLIFLTGNICSEPSNVDADDTSLTVYYSFNSSMFQNPELGQSGSFDHGYFSALADISVLSDNSDNTVLYIAVRAPENTLSSAEWSYEIGVSQNDLVFQWDDRSWASLVDADASSALIVSGNLTASGDYNVSTLNATESTYTLFLYSLDYEDYFNSLNSSWCAIRNGPALLSSSEYNTSFTRRGGGLQQQFYVDGLNSSTRYLAYLISDFSGRSFGGSVYKPFQFETMDDGVCQLVYDLEFCDQVAYSVPSRENMTKDELKVAYDHEALEIYSNFSKALQQIACETSADAAFSPIRTCDDCSESYKNWLCSVMIPRCSTRDINGYQERAIGESRNDFINDVIAPNESYFEVLPCVNVCQAMVRDCPADFGFMCPDDNSSASLSYYWDEGGEFATCNYLGPLTTSTSRASFLKMNWWLFVFMYTSIALVGL